MAESNPCFAQIIRRHLHIHLVADADADEVFAHLAGSVRQDFVKGIVGVGKGSGRRGNAAHPFGRVVSVILRPLRGIGLRQIQHRAQPVGVGVSHRVAGPRPGLGSQLTSGRMYVPEVDCILPFQEECLGDEGLADDLREGFQNLELAIGLGFTNVNILGAMMIGLNGNFAAGTLEANIA